MNIEHKMDELSLFPNLFAEKSQSFNFGAVGDKSLFDDQEDWMMDFGNDCGLRSVDQMCPPMEIKHDFYSPEFKTNIEQSSDMLYSDATKIHIEKFSEHCQHEDFIIVEEDMNLGVAHQEDTFKAKPIPIFDDNEDDNQTENEEPIEELDDQIEDLDEAGDDDKKQRKDVYYKTILRKCRKFYQQKFNSHTGFMRNKKKEAWSFYRDWIFKFIEEVVSIKTNLNISFHMGALLYPQEMIKRIESFVYPNGIKNFTPKKIVKKKLETFKLQVEKLHSILYKFTHNKLEKFISVPELAVIFQNYIEKSGDLESDDELFQKHIKDLLKRCKRSIGKSRKTRSVVTLFD